MLQRILVGLDGSALAETVLPFVTALAQAFSAEVKLVHVVQVAGDLPEEEGSPTRQELTRTAGAQALGYLEEVRGRLAPAGVTVKTSVLAGDAATEIVDLARREFIDLIALATHGRSGVQRLLYGSVAEKVMHTAGTPLLLIRPTDGAEATPRKTTHILVPLDGAPLAEAALPMAETLAAGLKVSIVLLRVVEIPLYPVADPIMEYSFDYGQLLDTLSDVAKSYLYRVAERLQGQGIDVRVATPVGRPAEEIHQHAENNPGTLIVMATHGRTGIVGGLMGSVARQALRADVPAVLVPPPAAPAAVS